MTRQELINSIMGDYEYHNENAKKSRDCTSENDHRFIAGVLAGVLSKVLQLDNAKGCELVMRLGADGESHWTCTNCGTIGNEDVRGKYNKYCCVCGAEIEKRGTQK